MSQTTDSTSPSSFHAWNVSLLRQSSSLTLLFGWREKKGLEKIKKRSKNGIKTLCFFIEKNYERHKKSTNILKSHKFSSIQKLSASFHNLLPNCKLPPQKKNKKQTINKNLNKMKQNLKTEVEPLESPHQNLHSSECRYNLHISSPKHE